MKNRSLYILLGVISVILLTIALYKRRDRKLITLYFFMAGYTYFLEYFVLVLFQGYAYHPEILKNEYFDNIMGAVVSDAFSIPMIAVFIAAFRLCFRKIVLVAVIMTIIEITFVKLKIYEHYWWSYFYTFGGAIITYLFCQKWLSIISGPINRITRYVTLFFSNLVIQASIVFVMAGIFHLYFYNINWFRDPARSHVAFATLYIMIITSILVSIVVLRLNWIWMAVGILVTYVSDIILLRMNILSISASWSLMGFLFLRIFILIFISLFNKHLLQENGC